MPDTLTGPALAYHQRIVARLNVAQQRFHAARADWQQAQQDAAEWLAVCRHTHGAMGPHDTIQADGTRVSAGEST